MAKPTRTYSSASDFQRALNDKLRAYARSEAVFDLPRLRRQIAFERFLARVFYDPSGPWVLKGGFAMELRIVRSRATKDVDLGFRDISLRSKKPKEQEDDLLERLRDLAGRDLNDFFQFRISEPSQSLTGAPFGGARFLVETRVAGKTFAKFHLDVAIGETILEPLDQLVGKDWLAFAGFASRSYPSVTKEQQFAEKVHAYTRPRGKGIPSRVRDFVDLILLVSLGTMDENKVRDSLKLVFQEHPTHLLPLMLPVPPETWSESFSALIKECGMDMEISSAFEMISAYFARIQA